MKINYVASYWQENAPYFVVRMIRGELCFYIGVYDLNKATEEAERVDGMVYVNKAPLWKKARPFKEWINKCKRDGRNPDKNDLICIDQRMEAYGDWTLYKDTDGTYYEDYFSIGD